MKAGQDNSMNKYDEAMSIFCCIIMRPIVLLALFVGLAMELFIGAMYLLVIKITGYRK